MVDVDEANKEKKIKAILGRHKAHSLRWATLPKVADDFERTLWKFAYGFFWVTCRKSLYASEARGIVLGQVPITREIDGKLCARDILSEKRNTKSEYAVTVAVYTLDKESHDHLYCELGFFEKLGFPFYRCRIPNKSGKALKRVEFSH